MALYTLIIFGLAFSMYNRTHLYICLNDLVVLCLNNVTGVMFCFSDMTISVAALQASKLLLRLLP